jgi:hypothetical protein
MTPPLAGIAQQYVCAHAMALLALLPRAWGPHGLTSAPPVHLHASMRLENTHASSTWPPDRVAVLVGGLMAPPPDFGRGA